MTGSEDLGRNRHPDIECVRLRPWREISAVSLLLMDLSWLVAWQDSLFRSEGQANQGELFLLYGAIVLSSYWVSKLMSWLSLNDRSRRVVLAVLLLGSYVLLLSRVFHTDRNRSLSAMLSGLLATFQEPASLLPPELALLILTGVLVVRSASLATDWIGVSIIRRRFRFGTSLLLVLGILTAFVPEARITGAVFVFLLLSFTALGTARLSTSTIQRGGLRQAFRLKRLLIVTGSAVLIAGLVYSLGALATENLAQATSSLFLFSARLILTVLLLLMTPVVLIVGLVISRLGSGILQPPIIEAIELELAFIIDTLVKFIRTISTTAMELSLRLPDISWLYPYLLWTLVTVLILSIIRGLDWRVRGQSRENDDRSVDQFSRMERTSLRSWVRSVFEARLGQLADRVMGFRHPGLLGAYRIRRIYSHLMRLCEQLDSPRPDTVTPLEFRSELELLFPGEQAEVNTITHAYNRVRYGELPETAEEIRAVERAWRAVRLRGVRSSR